VYKKLTIILLAASLVFAGLFVSQYLQNQNIKRGMLGQYVIAQHNISAHLNDAVEHHLSGDNYAFIINLQNAAGDFRTVDNIIAPGSLLGQHTNASDLMYTIHANQMSFINDSLNKAVNDELNDEDLNKIFSFTEAMEYYANLLDYNEIVPGNSPDRIVSSIDDKLDQTSQLYTGNTFEQ